MPELSPAFCCAITLLCPIVMAYVALNAGVAKSMPCDLEALEQTWVLSHSRNETSSLGQICWSWAAPLRCLPDLESC